MIVGLMKTKWRKQEETKSYKEKKKVLDFKEKKRKGQTLMWWCFVFSPLFRQNNYLCKTTLPFSFSSILSKAKERRKKKKRERSYFLKRSAELRSKGQYEKKEYIYVCIYAYIYVCNSIYNEACYLLSTIRYLVLLMQFDF